MWRERSLLIFRGCFSWHWPRIKQRSLILIPGILGGLLRTTSLTRVNIPHVTSSASLSEHKHRHTHTHTHTHTDTHTHIHCFYVLMYLSYWVTEWKEGKINTFEKSGRGIYNFKRELNYSLTKPPSMNQHLFSLFLVLCSIAFTD